MGFFTRKDKVRQSSSPPKLPARPMLPASLVEPVNVYNQHDRDDNHYRDRRPKVPPRQAITAGPEPQSGPEQRKHRHDWRHDRRHDQRQDRGVLAPLPYPHRRNASTPHLSQPSQPAGYLPPAQQQQPACGPVVVNNHYYLTNSSSHPPQNESSSRQVQRSNPSPYGYPVKFSRSVAHLAQDATAVPQCSDGVSAWYNYSANLVTSTVNVCDDISDRLNNVLTLIDGERMTGHEHDLYSCGGLRQSDRHQHRTQADHRGSSRSRRGSRDKSRDRGRDRDKERDRGNDAASAIRGDYFSKVELYANSKLPKGLPPMAVYIPTWPLLCLAAQHSLAVYEKPTGAAREAHVSADWRTGTKAMCIKSVPMDAMHTIVFAIRGTATFMDWAVNLNHAPTQPTNFLDDTGNLCHAGFLSVARRMVNPVAARLRQLLEEDPSRSRYSLLITGHSAGGAVASLLYCHMLAQSKEAESELNLLTSSFKRVHCVTFGTPPLSLLPLKRPNRPELKNSVFLSFINEGDPVVRADKAYIKSLLELLATAPPETKSSQPSSKERRRRNSSPTRTSKPRHRSRYAKPVWPVPPNTLSNAGRLIVMRSGGSERHRAGMTVEERLDAGVVAFVCEDDDLRGLVWGDPVAHMMKLYAKRVETLAVNAVTMKGS